MENHISIEDAVSKMINFNYIPSGFTLLEMTEAFMDEAKTQYEIGKFKGIPSDELFRLKYIFKACKARHQLAKALTMQFYSECSTSKDLTGAIDDLGQIKPVINYPALLEWGPEKYGIDIPETTPAATTINIAGQDSTPQPTKLWRDVTIKIYADNRLGFKSGNDSYHSISFNDIDLMGKRKNEPNQLGLILVRLSVGYKFPNRPGPISTDKTSISKLRAILRRIINIDDDPFYQFNTADGWKPKFKLIDDRNNANDRAKQRATHVSYDDQRDTDRPFEDENDDAADWLNNHE